MTYISNIQPSSFFAGQFADSNPHSLITQPNTDTVNIPFGVAMCNDATDQGYQLPAASTNITNRMAINMIINRVGAYSYDSNNNVVISGNTSVPPNQDCAGATLGYVAVVVEVAVTLGSPCFIRFATGTTGSQKGAFLASADIVSSSATAAVHPSWYYASAASAGSIAIVRVV